MMEARIFCYCFASVLILNRYSITAQPEQTEVHDYYSYANLSTTWTNTNESVSFFEDSPMIQPTLISFTSEIFLACGFYCNGTCTSYLFAVFIYRLNIQGNNTLVIGPAQVVWSANRDSPVSYGAILNFTATGELVLQDVDGRTVWSTNTAGKSVVGMNLTDSGNLRLFDVNGSVVWQSFDYPTDCLLPGQRLFQGQKLIPSVSSTNWTAQKGLFSLQVTDEGLVAYVGSNPRQIYYKTRPSLRGYASKKRKYIKFLNGSLSFFFSSADQSVYSIGIPDDYIQIPFASSAQYMRFMPDGHLKVFEWKEGWSEVADLLTDEGYGECTYPLACGRNAICSNYQQCSCPSSSPDYFRAVNDRQPNLGCSAITPLTCNATQDHFFTSLENVTVHTYSPADMKGVSMDICVEACLTNCSCKAAVFKYYSYSSNGSCYLPSELFTMISFDPDVLQRNTSSFIKVQNYVKSPSTYQIPKKKARPSTVVITLIIGSFLVLLVAVVITFLIRKPRSDAPMEEEYIEAVPGMPTRFTYEELKTATENFSNKLDQGGFGSVFEGTLEDHSKIAVKFVKMVKSYFPAESKFAAQVYFLSHVYFYFVMVR
ncbi:putative non-specific serine/threonine protein kinase [Helianthus annuus]|nr:putative non-specific serine/threonine protein kinase [Helianthus annuus]KAJ0662235.1 putative non-specific serine/threonine protein kinase [Helianthus annuus]